MSSKFFVLIILFHTSFSYKLRQNDLFTNFQIGHKSTARENGPFAENIKCERDNVNEYFGALLTLPTGFGTVPVFNEALNVNPSISDECIIKQSVLGENKFTVDITNFDTCGVQIQKGIDGEIWMSVSIRFPLIGALRTAEDEVITMICRPQDRIIVKNHVLDLKSSMLNPRQTIFSSSPLDFECNLEIFLRSENDESFTRHLPNDGIIEIGQEIQLRASVRSGDGWKYVFLRDVAVHKVMPLISSKKFEVLPSKSLTEIDTESDHKSSASHKESLNMKKSSYQRYSRRSLNREKRQIPDTAFLVLSDGCRNPVFRSIAEEHPIQHPKDNLIVNFNFKAFMFQDMEDSGTIRITAKIMACVEQQDCQPTQCIDDDEYGFGRRKRSVTKKSRNVTKINDFSRELEYRVVLPRFTSDSDTYFKYTEDFMNKRKFRHIIYFMGSLFLIVCLVITIFSSLIIIRSKPTQKIIGPIRRRPI